MEITLVPIESIKTNENLQPRNLRLVTGKHRGPEEKKSENHIQTLRELLESSKQKELDPIDVAELEGNLTVVDGHHRLKAYQKAKRKEIPVIICNLDMKGAYLRARTANAEGRALPMHREQCSEAAWQILLNLTNGGARELPEHYSVRKIASSTGATKSTVGKMIHKAKQYDGKWKSEFPKEACDPITGYPHWKYARGEWWREGKFSCKDEEAKRLAEITHIKDKLGSLLNQYNKQSFVAALEELAEEERIERDEIPEEFAPEF